MVKSYLIKDPSPQNTKDTKEGEPLVLVVPERFAFATVRRRNGGFVAEEYPIRFIEDNVVLYDRIAQAEENIGPKKTDNLVDIISVSEAKMDLVHIVASVGKRYNESQQMFRTLENKYRKECSHGNGGTNEYLVGMKNLWNNEAVRNRLDLNHVVNALLEGKWTEYSPIKGPAPNP